MKESIILIAVPLGFELKRGNCACALPLTSPPHDSRHGDNKYMSPSFLAHTTIYMDAVQDNNGDVSQTYIGDSRPPSSKLWQHHELSQTPSGFLCAPMYVLKPRSNPYHLRNSGDGRPRVQYSLLIRCRHHSPGAATVKKLDPKSGQNCLARIPCHPVAGMNSS